MSDKGQRRKGRYPLKKEPPFKRSLTIRLIGSYIPQLTRPAFKKHSPLLTRLVLDWEQFVGESLSRVSTPKRLTQGSLTISCHGPAAIEMQYNMVAILERINTSCGLTEGHKLTRLKIVQDQTMPSMVERNMRSKPMVITVDNFGEGPLKTALERLGGYIKARDRS